MEINGANGFLGFVKYDAGCVPTTAGIGNDEMNGVAVGTLKAVAALLAHQPQVAIGKLLPEAEAQAELGIRGKGGGVGTKTQGVGQPPCMRVDRLKLIIGERRHGPAATTGDDCHEGKGR